MAPGPISSAAEPPCPRQVPADHPVPDGQLGRHLVPQRVRGAQRGPEQQRGAESGAFGQVVEHGQRRSRARSVRAPAEPVQRAGSVNASRSMPDNLGTSASSSPRARSSAYVRRASSVSSSLGAGPPEQRCQFGGEPLGHDQSVREAEVRAHRVRTHSQPFGQFGGVTGGTAGQPQQVPQRLPLGVPGPGRPLVLRHQREPYSVAAKLRRAGRPTR